MLRSTANSSTADEVLLQAAMGSSQNLSDHYDDEDLEHGSSDESRRTSVLDTDNTGGTNEAARELKETVIKREEANVKRSRVLVGLGMTICAAAITVAVYFLAKKSDQHSFELEFEGIVKDIRTLVIWEVRYNFALMEQLSASVTIAAGYLNSTFPFHTEPKYEITGGFVDGMGGIMSAAFAPFVMEEQREEWGVYSRRNQGWLEESAYLKAVHPVHRDALHGTIQDHEHDRRLQASEAEAKPAISRSIYRWENGVKAPELKQPGQLYAPLWQVSPADYGAVNVNLLSDPRVASLYLSMRKRNSGVLSSNFEVGELFDFLFDASEKQYKKEPHAFILQPVYDKIIEVENQTMVGFLIAITPYGNLLDRLVPEGKEGIIGVFKDDCGNTMTFKLSAGKAFFMGYEDLHEPEFNQYERVERNLEMYKDRIEGVCTHDLYLYPSSQFRDAYNTSKAVVFTSLVSLAFLLIVALFFLYDWTVTQRQNKTIHTALKTQAIVTSLFPEEVGRQLINDAQQHDDRNTNKAGNTFKASSSDMKTKDDPMKQSAMAQLYPEATVMFADLVGFTAWSSMRDPPQVFQLLETIYNSFDEIANRRRVFKVETIGDCYVAVCGLPQQRKNHHIVMARFAFDCCHAIAPLLQKLGAELGPDTAELGIRIGLNSGPVTAGVLRADRARFQLFGDTVNTAARMESTGLRNRIHISKDTADLLVAAGKSMWVVPRGEKVHAKGKGQLETFWLEIKNDNTTSVLSGYSGTSGSGSGTETCSASEQELSDVKRTLQRRVAKVGPKTQRLVDWNADILLRSLREIVCHRKAQRTLSDSPELMRLAEDKITNSDTLVFDELADIISLPGYDASAKRSEMQAQLQHIDKKAIQQLRDYVRCIASMYRENSFHCFEHASHVTMSVNKLLGRIVAPRRDNEEEESDRELHENTYGLTSDPLTQFAIVLSALIHDVDHFGVANAQLVKEGAEIAKDYKGKSVLEQNSVDLAWNLLMEEQYRDLRRVIYCNEKELERFRQVVVVTVMATDIADKSLKDKRNARWERAFHDTKSEDSSTDLAKKEDQDRKATIVIEHIIQASDIAHTMQHWHIYRKWNERLFTEMYGAYKSGRTDTDPSTFWCRGEIGFFDFYIIPLAKKLKEAGVFGVSSDEYLNYAIKNREEWEQKGQEVVATYMAKLTEESD